MGKALYRKYRSKSLDEIVGQQHITKTLENALKKGSISHAYLLTGPKGVGKTSVARILAHAVNNLPYDENTTNIDIIEIDAASNRRIDEIRDLRDKVHITPSSAKYKVYIIDEVHMLTREAFNALLKTLEEPPEHAIFILATTESHKLPETIVSRTQRFTFKPIEPVEIATHLRVIADKEKIKISDEALQLIAEHGSGSFRDSISLLDQASNFDNQVELADIEHLLGIAPDKAVASLYENVASGTAKELLASLAKLREQGFTSASIAKQLASNIREEIIEERPVLPSSQLTPLLGQLLDVPGAHEPDSFLELVLLSPVMKRINTVEPIQSLSKIAEKSPTTEPVKPTTVTTPEPEPVGQIEDVAADELTTVWPQILATLKKRHNTLYSVVRMAEPSWVNDRLLLKFTFPFHQKRLNDTQNQTILSEVITEVTGQNMKFESVVDKSAQPPATGAEETKVDNEPALDTISNIFGNTELLE